MQVEGSYLTQIAETDSRYSWFRLVVTMLVAIVANAGMWAIIVILPAVQAEFGTSRADASLPYTLNMIGFGPCHHMREVLGAVGFGPLIADISHWFVRRRGIAVALVASGNYLSGAIWPMVLAGVMQDSGWRAVYTVMAVVTFVGIIPLALLLRRQVSSETHASAHAASARVDRCGTGSAPEL